MMTVKTFKVEICENAAPTKKKDVYKKIKEVKD